MGRRGEEERSMLGALEPGRRLYPGVQEDHSILADFNHIRDHIATLEEAARVARAVEFEQLRAVVEQLEAVAGAAKAVERDLSVELAGRRVGPSVSTARLVQRTGSPRPCMRSPRRSLRWTGASSDSRFLGHRK